MLVTYKTHTDVVVARPQTAVPDPRPPGGAVPCGRRRAALPGGRGGMAAARTVARLLQPHR